MHAGLQTQYNLWKIRILKELGTGVGKGNGVKLWEIQAVFGLVGWGVSQHLVTWTPHGSLMGVTKAFLLLLAFLCTKAETTGWGGTCPGGEADVVHVL